MAFERKIKAIFERSKKVLRGHSAVARWKEALKDANDQIATHIAIIERANAALKITQEDVEKSSTKATQLALVDAEFELEFRTKSGMKRLQIHDEELANLLSQIAGAGLPTLPLRQQLNKFRDKIEELGVPFAPMAYEDTAYDERVRIFSDNLVDALLHPEKGSNGDFFVESYWSI